MALLQNDKAIFYHPLDDETESLKAQAWTVGSGNLTGSGKLANAISGAAGDAVDSIGTQATFLNAFSATSISVTALSSTAFVVAYTDGSNASHGVANVGTVAGTSITFGTQATFLNAFSATDISVVALSSTAVVVAYTDSIATTAHGVANVGTVTGTSITFGTQATFLNAFSATNISVAALSSTAFVVTYLNINSGKANVGTVAGTNITFGAQATFLGAFTDSISATVLSSTEFVVAYRDSSNVNHGVANVGTVSGTNITFGTQATFLNVSNASSISAATLSATAFVVTYVDASVNNIVANVGTVTGTSIAFGAQATFLSAFTDNISAAAISPTTFVVTYKDSSNSSHGVANIGGLVSGASITASTPAAYSSVVAATKVAFAGWLKNPSA